MIKLNWQRSTNGSVLIATFGILLLLVTALYAIKESTIHKYQTAKLIEDYYQSRIMEEMFLQEYEKTLLENAVGTKGTVNYSIGSISYDVTPDYIYYQLKIINPSRSEFKKRMKKPLKIDTEKSS